MHWATANRSDSVTHSDWVQGSRSANHSGLAQPKGLVTLQPMETATDPAMAPPMGLSPVMTPAMANLWGMAMAQKTAQ